MVHEVIKIKDDVEAKIMPRVYYKNTLTFKALNTLNTINAALVIVDMQNDFLDPEGELYLGNQYSEASKALERVIANTVKAIYFFKQKHLPIFTVMDTHFPDSVEFKTLPEHCIFNSWGHKLTPAIDSAIGYYASNTVIFKDGFSSSEVLVEYIRELTLSNVYIVGVAYDICVFFTAMGIADYLSGSNIHILEDATIPYNKEWAVTAKQMMQSLKGINHITLQDM